MNRKVSAIIITCVLGWAVIFIATKILRAYSFGLFIWLPTVMGAVSTILLAYNNEVKKSTLRYVAFGSWVIVCLGLLLFAWEGVVCLVMAAPPGLLFTYIGYLIGYQIIKGRMKDHSITVVLFLVCSVPVLMAFESSDKSAGDIRSITTSIEINVNPEAVWKNVIEFPQLNAPTELIFKSGIAYPVNAQIEGHGVGAIRHCNFSTGSFVEPITVWDEAKLLKFDVDSQPEPLKELSFYEIHPNHLHGYWVSKGGQFKLTPLPNGHTLLEGTTWYENRIKPGVYWTIWSDYIVHAIHRRVLGHIKVFAERG